MKGQGTGWIRRCATLMIEPRETIEFDPSQLLRGSTGIESSMQAWAFAPHLAAPLPVAADTLDLLTTCSPSLWQTREAVEARAGVDLVARLLDCGLLVERNVDHGHAASDQRLRSLRWHPLSAVFHAFSRWRDGDVDAPRRKAQVDALEQLTRSQGPPPAHLHQRPDAVEQVDLPPTPSSPLQALMARRATARNFDLERRLELDLLATMLHVGLGEQGREEVTPGMVALKKNHPSGGSLHPLDAYLLVQRVEGLDSGLYHYNAGRHSVDLLRPLAATAARKLGLLFVAGQEWFADVHVQLVVVSRFARSHWKYRNHQKIYRAMILEAGHLSQNLYLTATELGLGAFITAAVNEVDIEQAFGLDPLQEGVLAVCGFGPRGAVREHVEFDPRELVWAGSSLA